ncbi:MAG: hypothetical protein ACQEW9_09010 [Bacteroidota bacterium]
MKKLMHFIAKPISIFLLAILLIFFNGMLMLTMPRELALDLKFAYSVSEAFSALESMGEGVRGFYQLGIWLLDFPYMIVYCLFFSAILYRLWGVSRLIWLPLAIAFFDLIENLSVLVLLKTFPAIPENIAVLASIFTSLKWVLVVFLMLSILSGLIRVLIAKKYSSETSSRYEI